MKRKRILPALILLGLVVVGMLIWRSRQTRSSTAEYLARGAQSRMVMRVEKGDLERTISASGFLSPQQIKQLYFSVGGKVKTDRLSVGKTVKKDEVLVELDSAKQELEYLKAQKAYDLAVISGLASQIREAELNLKIAKENLEATTLKAPFDGLITQDLVDIGDYVGINEQNAVGTIIADGPYEIKVEVDENESQLVKVGQPVKVTVKALPGRIFHGRVKEVALQATNKSGVVTLPVKVVLTEETELLKPEFSADLEIIVDEVKDQILAPITAIVNNRGQEQVMKIVEGKPVATPVKTGMSNGYQVVILGGLQPGEEILINAHQFSANQSEDDNSNRQRMMGGPGITIRGR